MTKREFFENELKMKPSEIGTAVPFNPYGETEVTKEWLIAFIKNLWAERNRWNIGTPSEGGLFLVYLQDGTYDIYEFGKEYKAWDIGFSDVVAYQKIEPYKEKDK